MLLRNVTFNTKDIYFQLEISQYNGQGDAIQRNLIFVIQNVRYEMTVSECDSVLVELMKELTPREPNLSRLQRW